ncbi:DNA-binding protein Fis [Roseibium suaedae]|uniref:DNA-binding protein Fis n=2 Tax=Roseibium suaedae TaxID=735517 RepID=A0A1M7NM18_9HYPH|nr:DNA-binding protein Fis [Roseibium suaedae]
MIVLFSNEAMLNRLPSAAIVIDAAADEILHANTKAQELLGPDAQPGQRFSGFIYKDLAAFIVFLDEVIYRRQAWTRAVQLIVGDGDRLNVEMRACQLDDSPNRILLLLIDLEEFRWHERVTDTEKLHREGLMGWRRAQEFFSELEHQNQLILNAAGEGIYGVNTKGQTTFVNRAAQEMLGWDTEDLLGKPIHNIIHHHHQDGSVYKAHDCPIYQAFRSEKVNRVEDEVFWRKDGRPIQVEYISTPIYDRNVLAGAVVIFRDVTERKLNDKKLREALAEVAELRDRLEKENAYLQEAITNERAHHDVIGHSPAIRQTHAKIKLVAPTDAPVFITGEIGAGKAIVANSIHKESSRKRRPLIQFRCGSISRRAMEMELFGHVGTGEHSGPDTSGALELANGGTLYLEDICDLPLDLQGELLRVLQDKKFKRVNDARFRNLNIRVIASSAKNVEQEVALGRFREDLYLLLSVFPIHCIPLRDRREDIPELTARILEIMCERLNRKLPIVTERTMQTLMDYHWPGNVRELRNVIERAAIVSTGGKLIVELGQAGQKAETHLRTVRTEKEMQQEVRANLVAALRETGGRVAGKEGAAALLDMKPTTVYSRIEKLQIKDQEWCAD